jgi:hypothetical protein
VVAEVPAEVLLAEPLPEALPPQAVRHIMAIIPAAKTLLYFFIMGPPLVFD